ncbi:MAG: DUF2834 domain-containing protein [Woeseiaceae bacterium]|nr:DUF2834 domain-containing protein [Woeseiaceae bacterium]
MKLRNVYLLLAIAGALVPYLFFIGYFEANGFAVTEFVAALLVTAPAAGFTADLLISSLVFWIAMFARRHRENGPNPLLFIVLNVTIGLSCALPAYLYEIERQK